MGRGPAMEAVVIREIDLNADLGEGMGDDVAMLSIVTSASVASGGHAGDHETMREVSSAATARGVVIGAHPSFEDRDGFGRRARSAATGDIERLITEQVRALATAAAEAGAEVRYVKLHGALANLAAADAEVASVVTDVVGGLDEYLPILAISGTRLEATARAAGLTVHSEVFADRGYQRDGQLVDRSDPGAIIHDPLGATERMLAFLETGSMPTVDGGSVVLDADSICVHGDSPSAVAMATSIRTALDAAGVAVRSFVDPSSG